MPRTKVPKVPRARKTKEAEFERYAALMRGLERNAALKTSELPAEGEAGPSAWQAGSTGRAAAASLAVVHPTLVRVESPAAATADQASQRVRWPLPLDQMKDDTRDAPNCLSNALQSYATTRIYNEGFTYPEESESGTDEAFDIQQLLETKLPPGVSELIVRTVNQTLTDVATFKAAWQPAEGEEQPPISWRAVLHAAAVHCSPSVIQRVQERMRARLPEAGSSLKRSKTLASYAVPTPDVTDMLASLSAAKTAMTKPRSKRKQSSTHE